MKNYLKVLSAFTMLLMVASCGDKEDDPGKTDLEDVKFSFGSDEPPINISTAGLFQSEDENAQQIGGLLQSVNVLSQFTSYLEVPAGAEKSDTPISTGSGRVASGDVLVYTWTTADGMDGSITLAYQISQTADNYIFEFFWKLNEGDYERIIYAEESKDDLKSGFMEIYAALGEESSGDYIFKFTWDENEDGQFTYVFSNISNDFKITIVVEADQSGSLEVAYGGVTSYVATWNAAATGGSYTVYDESGEEIHSGSWTA